MLLQSVSIRQPIDNFLTVHTFAVTIHRCPIWMVISFFPPLIQPQLPTLYCTCWTLCNSSHIWEVFKVLFALDFMRTWTLLFAHLLASILACQNRMIRCNQFSCWLNIVVLVLIPSDDLIAVSQQHFYLIITCDSGDTRLLCHIGHPSHENTVWPVQKYMCVNL